MSLTVNNNTTQEINASLLELRRKADKAISAQASLKVIVYNNLDSLSSAFDKVSDLIYQITYYQSIINQGKYGLIEIQRRRLQYKVDELTTTLATLRQELSSLQTRRSEIGTELSNAKSILNSLISSYNTWITNVYNPTKSSLEAEIAECNRLITYYQTQIDYYTQERDTAQADIDGWYNRISNYVGDVNIRINATPPLSVTVTVVTGTYSGQSFTIGPNEDYGLILYILNGLYMLYVYNKSDGESRGLIHPDYTKQSVLDGLLSVYNKLQEAVDDIDGQISYYETQLTDTVGHKAGLMQDLADLEEQKTNKEAAIASQQDYVNQLQAEYDAIPSQIANVRNEINQTYSDLTAAEEALEEFNERYPTS